MEVAARQRVVWQAIDSRKNQRVVGHAIGLGCQQVGGVVQHVQAGTHDLGLAAQAVGVLHALVATEVRGADGAARQQLAQRLGGGDLAFVFAQRVYARVKRCVGALGRVGRQRARQQCRLEQAFGLEQASQSVGSGKLRAIEQGQTLFGAQHHGGQAHAGQGLGGGFAAGGRVGFAHANHHGRHVRQRSQVARCTH